MPAPVPTKAGETIRAPTLTPADAVRRRGPARNRTGGRPRRRSQQRKAAARPPNAIKPIGRAPRMSRARPSLSLPRVAPAHALARDLPDRVGVASRVLGARALRGVV